MTRKNRWRLVVYTPLVAVVAFVLMHPYFRQQLFGPKIKGEPFWAWQQEFRAERVTEEPDTLWKKMLGWVGANDKTVRWIGYFPANDPEMLPVLLSLVDDPSSSVRLGVAHRLKKSPSDSRVIDALVQLTRDRDHWIRGLSAVALGEHGDKALSALPRLREMLHDEHAVAVTHAAVAINSLSGYDATAIAALELEVRSGKDPSYRGTALWCIAIMGRDSEREFNTILWHSRNDSSGFRGFSLNCLGHFGKKALPHLLPYLDDPAANLRRGALDGIAMLGDKAAETVPRLVEIEKSDSDAYVRLAARRALQAIDPNRVFE